MNLPYQSDLPIHLLAACFNKTSATYKFYWFLSIISKVEAGVTTVNKRDLFIEMIAHSWFTVNYFHISFGKQDKLQVAIDRIKTIEHIPVDAKRQQIINALMASGNKETFKHLQYFNSEVPHRFLSPWFNAADMSQAYQYSQAFTNNCPEDQYPNEFLQITVAPHADYNICVVIHNYAGEFLFYCKKV